MRQVTITKLITALYLLTAVVLSFTHIAALFAMMNETATWETYIAPVMIDGMAVIGKISMSPVFSAKARRNGRNAFWIAGSISLIANVTVGYVHSQYGSALLGLIVVAGAMWAEGHLTILKPKATREAAQKPAAAPAPVAPTATPAKAEPTAEQREKWAAAGRKAAATRKANAAKATVPAQRTAPAIELDEDTRAYI